MSAVTTELRKTSSQRANIRRILKFILITLFWLLLAFLTTGVSAAEAPPEEVKPVVKTTVIYFKQHAYDQVTKLWNEEEWKAFDKLIQKESSWNNDADNPASTAYGYGQFLDSTWSLVGCVKTNDPTKQIDCTIKYIQQTYETPSAALKFHIQNNYY